MILYKKDTKNKIRIWKIETDGAYINQWSGLLDGKLIFNQKIAKGKNIGKSNETTPEEQAIKEIKSKIESKLTEGYFRTLEEAQNEEVVLPMLAKSYEDEKHKIDWTNCYIQPKLDGMRCLAHIKTNGDVKLISRDGKIITTAQHIIDDLSNIKEDIILDGELYSHGLSFQENMKLKKHNPELIKFHVYDIVSKEPFFNRAVRPYIEDLSSCYEVSTYRIRSEEQLKVFHARFIGDGYEGSIIRWGNEGYKVNGRSSNLLKYKDFKDLDALIIDIEPGDQRPEWGIPVLQWNNKTFRSGVRMSHEDRVNLLINKDDFIGKIANIRYFELTDEGIPRFPIMVGVHEDR
jgi:ATP-dependent DNA ligase